MKSVYLVLTCLFGLLVLMAAPSRAAELLLPQNRSAFFSEEAIEISVVDLPKDAVGAVQLIPATPGAQPLAFTVTGDGTTMTLALPPHALAPGSYTMQLDGRAGGKFTVSSGVWQSTMFVTQAGNNKAFSNFILGNLFGPGLVEKGQPMEMVRGKKSGPMNNFELATASNTPFFNFMYWSGYITHKPFGKYKSWAEADMMQTLRQINFASAQRMRKYKKNIHRHRHHG